MATIRPFRALRPRPDEARAVCSPPYDVVSTDEARSLAASNPACFLRVTRPEIDLPTDADPHAPETYAKGGETLRQFISDGLLAQDPEPALYLYRQVMGTHAQVGLVGVFSCEEYEKDIIKKHELTRPDKEDDRKNHIMLLGAQTGPVFLTYPADPAIDSIAARIVASEPEVDFTAEDGVRHTAWPVPDAADIDALQAAFSAVPGVYIADGHHRSAAAVRVWKEKAATAPSPDPQAPYNFFLGVAFPHDQMQILGYNRVVADLGGMGAEGFLAALAPSFTDEELAGPEEPRQPGEATMYLGGKWYRLMFHMDEETKADPVASLDASFLQDRLLAPLLGIDNPRTDGRIAFVGGIRGLAELKKLVDSGDFAVAFAMFPTSVEQLMAVADAGRLMPPKSTWFEPKLRDAMMVHLI